MSLGHIKVLYWNIHGIDSQIVGEKQKNSTFLDIVSQYDIICISELHTKKDISIQGFTVKKQKFRTIAHKGPKISGGIAVYVKQNIAGNFHVIPNNNIDSIWIRTTPQTGDVIQLGFFYCSPENKKQNTWDIAEKEIEHMTNHNHDSTYILGDFNARTRTECENVAYDKFDDELGIPTKMKAEDIPLPRNSEDRKLINNRGKDFLDTCRTNDLCIANGRTIGDIFGRYTCHQPRGSSVVDYLIAPFRVYQNIIEFKVGEYLPSLSDHCPLTARIKINNTNLVKLEQIPVTLHDLPDRYIWKEEDSECFKDRIDSDEFQEAVSKMMESGDHENMVHDIQNLLKQTANECNVKKTRKRNKKPDPPWFDRECKKLKDNIRKYGGMLRQQPDNTTTRVNLYVDKKKLRNMVRKNKYNHRKSIVDNMCENLSKGEKKQYWQMLRKLEDSKDDTTYMHEQRLINHFKDILHDPNVEEDNMPKQDNSTRGSLDEAINKDELDVATKILKSGKSPGLDNVINEMIAPLVKKYPELILKLFNNILTNTWINGEWMISLITAIHKKGPKEDPDNYRGISLMSCLFKLFLTIVNNRITAFALEHNILSPNQLGFVQMNRTSDPHIILNNIVRKYCHIKGKKIYGCFVDFSKAFDSVPRDILLRKLLDRGINGKVFEIIRKIYTEDMAAVKFGNKASEPFKTNKGVRQGCVLSPLLFNIFLSDIQEVFDVCGDNPTLNDMEISSLIWADDILILSENPDGLQAKLDNLGIYCHINKLKVNTDKTKIMTFTKSGRLLKHNFYFGKKQLSNVRQYKYLGFIVTPSGEINTGLEDLRIRALRALTKIRKALGPLFQQNVWNTMYLYNYLVMPILLYTSDFWGTLKHPKNSPIERLHRSFYKQVLGVKKQTNTCAVHLETGTVPIIFRAVKSSIKNWERIREGKCNLLLAAAFQEATTKNLPWIESVKNTFEKNGLLHLFYSTESEIEESKTPNYILFMRLKDQYQQEALEEVRSSSKLRFYSKLKSNGGMEKYLTEISNVKHRTALTRIRMSSHSLNIEEGRYTSTLRENRICSLCRKDVEDETHFLIKCPMYKGLKHYLTDYNNILTSNMNSNQDKAVKLLSCRDLKPIAKYVYEAFEERKIMIDSLTTLNNVIENIDKQEKVTAKIETDVKYVIGSMIAKIENTFKSDKIDQNFYAIKDISSDGLKLTIHKGKNSYAIKNISNDGLRFKITWGD